MRMYYCGYDESNGRCRGNNSHWSTKKDPNPSVDWERELVLYVYVEDMVRDSCRVICEE